MNMNDKKSKIKAIADYIERVMETPPEKLGDDNIIWGNIVLSIQVKKASKI